MPNDWIDTFVEDTSIIGSCEPYRLWTAIGIIAGALERRVWTHGDRGPLYPNLFTLLSGSPSSGKTLMVNEARKLWSNISDLHIGPDNPTKSSFLRQLANSIRDYTNGSGAVRFCAMSMACREFSVLFAKTESQFFGDMTDLYDNIDQFTAPRTSTQSTVIEKPTINILAGVTPDFLADLLPESAWGQGFTSRLLFIYGTKIHDPNRDAFEKRPQNTYESLQEDLKTIFKLNGEFKWEKDAQEACNKWFAKGLPPVPDYGRLVHYIGRREAHIWKLCMISAVSYSKSLIVTLADFQRAQKWLLNAELTMPDVFKSMRQKSDAQIIEDAYLKMYSEWLKQTIRKPLSTELLWQFFYERTTSDKIQRLIDAIFQSGLIRQGQIPGTFVPQPREN